MKSPYSKTVVCIEFSEEFMHALNLDEGRGIDLPIERDQAGRLTAASRDLARNALRGFAPHGMVPARGGFEPEAICAVPARGVSLRVLSLPASARENIGRLLLLQLEAQLPLSPSELAWGYTEINTNGPQAAGGAGLRNFLVAAVKKEFVEDYTQLAREAGYQPHLAIAALARCSVAQESGSAFGFLELGRNKSELALVDEKGGVSIRVFPWGSTQPVTASLQSSLPGKLYLSGVNPAQAASALLRAQPSLAAVVVNEPHSPGQSAANAGAQRLLSSGSAPMLLGEEPAAETASRPRMEWKWAAAACLLLLISLLLRYAEATLYRAKISRSLAKVAQYKQTLPKVDRELSFLNFMKTNQPPYLEAIAVVADAAPPGTHLDSLNLVRHGDLAVRGSTGDPNAPGTFRSKLIDSGFFSHVVIEEQTPVENGQKINFRMSALVKPDGMRKAYRPKPPAKSTNAHENSAPPHPPSGKEPGKHAGPQPQFTQK